MSGMPNVTTGELELADAAAALADQAARERPDGIGALLEQAELAADLEAIAAAARAGRLSAPPRPHHRPKVGGFSW